MRLMFATYWMSKPDYLARIAIARSQKSSRSSADAYAQVDRMAKSTSGASTTRASGESSLWPKSAGATTKVKDSMAFARPRVAVFDLRPANVVRTADGLIVPIDTIPVKLDAAGERVLGM